MVVLFLMIAFVGCEKADKELAISSAQEYIKEVGIKDAALLNYSAIREFNSWQVTVMASDEWKKLHPEKVSWAWPLSVEVDDDGNIASFM